eukprot:TRINITY_DN1446_c0_g1_i1.p1 TRINITY_DN1446_c0_g1~~TRINITY_DN1446_c0_g1_i1.p1  ORF type:complete len:503 (+),score=148.73 TRINITY_DN1446_c0_g1_i1:88-1509(+)
MAAATTFEEAQVVRLHKLKLLQARHNGTLAATQEYIPKKGLWRVRLPSGDALEVPSDCMKAVDSQSRFAVGQVVRVRGVGVLHPHLNGSLVAVQEYLPTKDMWRVLTPAGEKAELYGENLKVLDPADLFSTGEVLRLVGLGQSLQMAHNNKVCAVQEYVPLADQWRVVLPGGSKLEVHSENLRKVAPDAYSTGDMVLVKGQPAPVAVQQYLPDTDQWRVRLPSGAALDAYPENLRRQDEAGEDPGRAWEALASAGGGAQRPSVSGAVGGLMGKLRIGGQGSKGADDEDAGRAAPAPAAAAGGGGGGGVFGRMRQAAGGVLGRGGYSGGSDARGAFSEGDVVHLCGLMMKSDGTMAVVQEWNEKKRKWRVRLNTGDAVEVGADNLRPAANPQKFSAGQLVQVSGTGKRALDGKVFAVQDCVEAKGMWRVRLPTGEAAEVWESCITAADPDSGAGTGNAQGHAHTVNPVFDSLGE